MCRLQSGGWADCEAFLETYRPRREACLLIDAALPGMSGLQLLQHLGDAGDRLAEPIVTYAAPTASVCSSLPRARNTRLLIVSIRQLQTLAASA